jgi:hypothetical protein
MNRRRFIETSLAGSLATLATTNGLSAATPAHITPLASNKLPPVSQLKKRVAISFQRDLGGREMAQENIGKDSPELAFIQK